MINQHPITPPPELVLQWRDSSHETYTTAQFLRHVATQAARWGYQQAAERFPHIANQELEACCNWLGPLGIKGGNNLRAAMRPKPPSLKAQALAELAATERCHPADYSTIRRALEALPND